MKNYRTIGSSSSLISALSSGKSQGGASDAIVYDIKPVSSINYQYTVPRKGELFYFGSQRDEQIFPAGMETKIAFNISEERSGDPIVVRYQLNTIKKKSVVAGEVLNFINFNGTVGGMIVLVESGSELSSYLFKETMRENGTSPFSFDNPNFVHGFGWVNYVITLPTTLMIENYQTKQGYSLLVNIAGERGSGIYNYGSYLTFNTNDNIPFKAASILLGKIKKGGSEVKHIEKLGLSIDGDKVCDFIASEIQFLATIDGYMIFIGAYRSPDNNILINNGWTVLKSKTRTTYEGSITQTIFIAYKKIKKLDSINFKPTQRFGGTFYQTYTDLSTINFTSGDAIKNNNTITFPVAQENKTLFGIIGFIWNTSSVSTIQNNDALRYNQSPTDKRLTCLTSVDFLRNYSNNLYFNYTENPSDIGDVNGIWLEF